MSQRGAKARTKYVVRRMAGTRTKSARWAFGQRTRDARQIGKAFSDDVVSKALRAFEPDLNRIAALNPRAARQVERTLKATMENAIALLNMAVQGMTPDGHED
jgi:hypothetical protein